MLEGEKPDGSYVLDESDSSQEALEKAHKEWLAKKRTIKPENKPKAKPKPKDEEPDVDT